MTAQPQSANARTKKNASSRPRGYFKYLQPCFWGSEGLWSTWDWDLKWKGHRSMKVAVFIRTAAGKGWKPCCCEHIFSDLLPSHKSVPPCFTRHLHLGWHSGKKLPPIKELKAFQCCLTSDILPEMKYKYSVCISHSRAVPLGITKAQWPSGSVAALKNS